MNTAVFSVIFTRVAPIETPVPYPLFAFCGLLVWNFFASSLRFSVTVADRATPNLVTKVYFPREIFPFSAVLVCLVDFAVGVDRAGRADDLLRRRASRRRSSALPVVLAVHVAFTAGDRAAAAMGNLFYRDVKYLFEVVITVWMFATSVLYPVDAIGGRLGWRAGAQSDDARSSTPIARCCSTAHAPIRRPSRSRPRLSFAAPGRGLAALPPRRVPRSRRTSDGSSAPVVFDGVWKKFRRGERHDSLRDLIPSLGQTVAAGRAGPTAIAERPGVLGGPATCRSRSAPARRSASSARTAPASRRCSSC